MSQISPTPHITPEEIVNYMTRDVSADREAEIEEHFAECSTCTEEARQLQIFNTIWDNWTAQTHGEAYKNILLTNALQRVQEQETNQVFGERLRHWLNAAANRTGVMVDLTVQAGESVSRLITEGLEALFPVEAISQPAPATGPVRTRGSRLRTTKSSPPRPLQVRIEVNGAREEVEVCVENIAPTQKPLLMVVIPLQEGQEPIVNELKRQADASRLFIRLTNIAPGNYLTAFEPAESSDT